MKALLCHAFGEPETLTMGTLESRAPLAGEVRIRVEACGVNYTDVVMVQGQYQTKPPFPFSPGLEVAGEVLEVGEGVTSVTPGQPVMALLNYGGMAEEVCTPAGLVIPRPAGMSAIDGAAFMVSYGTSHVALAHRAQMLEGETLLVLGAGGGTGLTAVEIGKHMGATVIACASTPEKLALAQQYGADHLINYRSENLREQVKTITGGRGVNVVYDPVGGGMTELALRSLAWEGRLLVIGFASGSIPQLPANLTLVKNCAVIGVFWGGYTLNNAGVLQRSLRTLLGWYSEGKLKPPVTRTYPLEQGGAAIDALWRREAQGKVVVTIP